MDGKWVVREALEDVHAVIENGEIVGVTFAWVKYKMNWQCSVGMLQLTSQRKVSGLLQLLLKAHNVNDHGVKLQAGVLQVTSTDVNFISKKKQEYKWAWYNIRRYDCEGKFFLLTRPNGYDKPGRFDFLYDCSSEFAQFYNL